ncbi:hypothetical protein [Haloarchaeobius sp. TZWWS8]|uniref:hypothetical protein n=1 Tax=Haloarchaeobius sp. TZWWS8 TaxID=3446121 RepID=UPI003EBDAFEC
MTRQKHDARDDEEQPESEGETSRKHRHDEHLRDVEVGAGCTEIWEHLSDQRDEE